MNLPNPPIGGPALIGPCMRCPYRLGLVKTLINPCPQCIAHGFSFVRQSKGRPHKKKET